MDKNTKELRQYFKEIKKQTYTYTGSTRFRDDLKNDIYSFISDNPDVSMDDIFKKYGTPSELAGIFFQYLDMETFEKKTVFAKCIKRSVLVCFVLFIVLLLCLFAGRLINQPSTVEYTIKSQIQGGL